MTAIDLTEARTVEVTISDNADGARLWVHVDGEMVARVYRIGAITIDDRRTKLAVANEPPWPAV